MGLENVAVPMFVVACDKCRIWIDEASFPYVDGAKALADVRRLGWLVLNAKIPEDAETYCPDCERKLPREKRESESVSEGVA